MVIMVMATMEEMKTMEEMGVATEMVTDANQHRSHNEKCF
jgi:hypothetical protein